MIHSITNGKYTLCADDFGAELSSVKTNADGYEYIWQKCEIWKGQSPILFPVVGKLKNDELKIDGRTYTMPKHGFARKSAFKFDGDEDGLSFTLSGTPETFPCYPYDFSLNVRFVLTETGYKVIHSVKNNSKTDMYFSLGAHPAFVIRMGDSIIMDKDEASAAYRLGADGLIKKEQTPVFEKTRELVIKEDTFIGDALIFDGLNSNGCTIQKSDGRNVHVDFGGAPCLGIWAKPGAQYVCVEPWYGLDDKTDSDWSFTEKKHVVKLAPGCILEFPINVTLY